MFPPKDLLKVFGKMSSQPEKGQKLVERMCRLQLVGVAETKAVLDLCKWPVDDFKSLLEVLGLFENYETEDVKEMKRSIHMNQGKLSRGEVLNMTNKTLISLSKVDSKFFAKESENIIARKISVKSLVSNYEKAKDLTKLITLVEEISKNTIDVLQTSFPNKFTEKALEIFVGAEVSLIKSNTLGELLKKYIKEVLDGEPSENGAEIKMFQVEDPRKEMSDEEERRCDARVYHMKKSEEDSTEQILDQVSKSKIPTILIFGSEEEQLDAVMTLKVKASDNFQVSQIFFDKENPEDTENVFTENLVFGIVCGSLGFLSKKINMYNGNISNLRSLCETLTNNGSTLVSVTDSEQSIVEIHSKDLDRSVIYISTKPQLLKLREDMRKEGGFISKPKSSDNEQLNEAFVEDQSNSEEMEPKDKRTEETRPGSESDSNFEFTEEARNSGHRSVEI